MTHPFVNGDCSDSDHGRPPLPADIKGNHSLSSCKNSNSQSGEVGTLQKQAPPNLPFGETQLRPFCPTNKKKRALPTHLPGNWMQPRWRDAVIPVGGVVVVVVVVTKLLVTPWCTLLCFYLAHLNIWDWVARSKNRKHPQQQSVSIFLQRCCFCFSSLVW